MLKFLKTVWIVTYKGPKFRDDCTLNIQIKKKKKVYPGYQLTKNWPNYFTAACNEIINYLIYINNNYILSDMIENNLNYKSYINSLLFFFLDKT